MRELYQNLGFSLVIFLVFSLPASNAQNDVVQQPSIMVIPSDNLLNRMGCLEIKEIQGRQMYFRDYSKAFLIDSDLKFMVSSINEKFAEIGFPLEDLEQSLKSVQTESAYDNIENFDTDPKTLALNTARPDIIIDLTYEVEDYGMNHGLSLTLQALDAYTNKSIGSAQFAGTRTSNPNIKELMTEQVDLNLNNLQNLMQMHFSDLRANGREITLRVAIENSVINDLRRDRCGSNLPYARWIREWLKRNTTNGAPKQTKATAKELRYTLRIPLYGVDEYAMSAQDFAIKLTDAISDECGVFALDYTQGLGDAFIVFTE